MERIKWIDLMRGIAMFSVVLQHLTNNVADNGHLAYMTIIGEVNMGVFFFVSAYLISGKKIDKSNRWSFLNKRILTLLLPFFVWDLFVYRYFFANSLEPINLLTMVECWSNPHLWFLRTLFLYTITYWIINQTIRTNGGGKPLIFWTLAAILLNIAYLKFGILKLEAIYVYYYAAGVIARQHKEHFAQFISNKYVQTIALLYICLFACYWQSGHTSMTNVSLKIGSTFSAIVLLQYICSTIIFSCKIERFFMFCGKESIAIYLIHWVFLSLPTIPYIDNELLISIPLILFSIVICYLCGYIHNYIQRIPPLNIILFGGE